MINQQPTSTDNYKQKTWMWATPLVAMLLFILAMAAFLYALHKQDETQVRETVIRDVEVSRQNMRGRLQTAQDRISQLARDLSQELVDETNFMFRARELLADTPEMFTMGVMDPERFARWVRASPKFYQPVLHPENLRIEDAESYWAFDAARESLRSVYSRPFIGSDGEVYVEVHAPIMTRGRFQGTVFAVFPINALLNVSLPEDFRRRYLVSIIDTGGNPLATNVSRSTDHARLSYEVPLDPPGHGLRLRAVVYRSTPELAQNMLAWTVVGLSVLILWSFGMLWRHTKLRGTAERRLLAETKFRRAMENSVITGMRALDMSGRITYVNPAFCRMTGYSEDELIGKTPPFPYWPKDNFEGHQQNLAMLLSGQAPASGLEVDVMRKDGSRFDARFYVSPLIDSQGMQSGWMTSMTDITEPKRVREELAAAHGRFTKVLEEIDAAVSVTSRGARPAHDLLFANRLHKEWFGDKNFTQITQQLPMQRGPGDTIEWQQPETGRWFEVRMRLIPWVDGRLVNMQVATDITSRKQAEEMARQQQEKLQFTSRLVTMGELASSLAHELNQPLSAIANYCMGSVTRLKAGKAKPEDILPAMEKASAQAQRAGNVIRRIREFVKRKAPNRRAYTIETIVEDAVSFAELDAKNRMAQIQTAFKGELALVCADPILIEQVLLNLIKNAMDAMRDLPPQNRIIEVQAEQQEQYVKVSVADRGCGVPDELKEKLFESFFSTKADGMGMGLNICRGIIEYHEGRLWVDAREGQGSVFCFTLPVATPDDEPITIQESETTS